jgi:hypothetical protein
VRRAKGAGVLLTPHCVRGYEYFAPSGLYLIENGLAPAPPYEKIFSKIVAIKK